MARQFLTGLNLNKNELLNARIQNLALEPSVGSSVAGQIYFNTSDSTLRYFNGTTWLTLAQGGDVSSAINNAINALTTFDIEEDPNATTTSGTMYFTDQRAKDAAADLITSASQTNITITGDGNGLTIVAENGVADSTTADLAEDPNATVNSGTMYFTNTRARAALSAGDGIDYNSTTGEISADIGSGLEITNGEIVVDTDIIATRSFATGEVTDHNNDSTGVHGLGATSAVVGTTDSQTLTNKELGTGSSLGADLDASDNKITGLADPTNLQDAATKNYVDTEIGDHSDLTTGVHGVTGSVVGTQNTQTLTNKTLGASTALGANLDGGTYKITNLGTPTASTDAATKGYVDSVAEGLHVHASVKVASTQNQAIGEIALAPTIDGVILEDGFRVLLKNQTDPAENGIYVWDGSPNSGLFRAADYNTAAEIDAGDFVFVDGGNTYANTGWVQTNAVTTLGTDPVDWVQFSGAGTFTAGDGLTLDGTEFNVGGTADRITVTDSAVDIASTYAGQASITTLGTVTTGTWSADTIAVNKGGTGATTAAGAKTNLGFMTRVTALNPELTPSSGIVTWTVTHNLGTKHVLVQVYETDFDDAVEVDIERTNTNQITLQWVAGSTVAAEKYEVIIIG